MQKELKINDILGKYQENSHSISQNQSNFSSGSFLAIKAVAMKNQHHRYFVPGKNNYFEDIQYSYVMFDSGCNTLLLPFPHNISFEAFEKKFQDYKWQIRLARGIGLFNPPTLKISAKFGSFANFIIKLDLSSENFSSPVLKFRLTIEDAKTLITQAKHKLSEGEIKELEQYVNIITMVVDKYPNIEMKIQILTFCWDSKFLKNFPLFNTILFKQLLIQMVLIGMILL